MPDVLDSFMIEMTHTDPTSGEIRKLNLSAAVFARILAAVQVQYRWSGMPKTIPEAIARPLRHRAMEADSLLVAMQVRDAFEQALNDPESLEKISKMYHEVSKALYDTLADPEGGDG